MRKILQVLILLLSLLLVCGVYAGQKTTALNEDTSPTSTDIGYTVDDPGGTPTSKKATWANIVTKAHGLGNYKALYTDGSGVITGLSLGADDTFLLSTGASGALEMRVLAAGDMPATIDATKIGDGTVTSAEFQYVGDVTGLLQAQLDLKAPLASPTFTGTVVLPSNQALLGSPTFVTSILPAAAGVGTVGSPDYEVAGVYLGASGVLYGEADQSNTLTSSATGWVANLNFYAATYGSDGSVTDTELKYVDFTSSGQTQLDVRCLESVFGTSIGNGLTLDGTVLKTHASLQSIAGQTETNGGLLYGTADNTYAWLAAGATTKILVGGGAAAPVWTEAEGSGAPVRATSPTLVTPNIGAATGTSFTPAKLDGVAGQMGVYEANSTETSITYWLGADSLADSLGLKFSNDDPTAGQMMIFSAPSSDISSVSWTTHTKEAAWTIVDSDTVTAVADGKQAFVVPASMNLMLLTDFTCSVADLNSAASDATTVVLRRVRAGTPQDMTSTGVTISYNEYTASDETVDASYDDLATGDNIYVDVNAVTTAVQKGLSCTAVFSLP